MPRASEPRHVEARLLGIELPRVDVERARNAPALAVAQGRAHHPIREQTEIPTASRRNGRAPPPQRGRGHLSEPTRRTLEPVRVPATVRIAVPRAAYRKQARVVPVAFLDQD